MKRQLVMQGKGTNRSRDLAAIRWSYPRPSKKVNSTSCTSGIVKAIRRNTLQWQRN